MRVSKGEISRRVVVDTGRTAEVGMTKESS